MPSKSYPMLVDSHVHIDDDRLSIDLARVISTAREHHIVAQVVPAVSQRYWPRLKKLCDAHADLHPCYGLHPYLFAEHTDDHLQELAQWLGREPAVAVGECGLDYAVAGAAKTVQQNLFAAQLMLAKKFNLPIVIHAVRAVEDVIRMIRASGHNQGMVHSFNGSIQQAHKLIDLGFSLSFGGAVTYPRATRLRSMVAKLPLDSILLETDAPDQPALKYKNTRNEPAYLVEVWQAISALRDEDEDTVANTTTANAQRLFRLPAIL